MTDWVVRRWTRYGHDRLYAQEPGGTALGYLDLATGRFHCDDDRNLPLLEQAVRQHQVACQAKPPDVAPDREPISSQRLASGPPSADHPAPAETPEPGDRPGDELSDPPVTDAGPGAGHDPADRGQAAPRVEDPAVPGPPDWTDLDGIPAGAAARERALAERAAQGRVRHFVARMVGARTDERAWRLGADGEVAVAAQLAKLGPAWRVLHAVRVGDHGSDIDHVVIGPGGVFTVNTKHHPDASVWVGGDTFLVNGHRVPYVRNSRHEARRTARLLSEHAGFPVSATGLIAVMGAHKGFTVKQQPEDGAVVVLPRKRVSEHLLRRPPLLTGREIDAIFDVARRSTTWQSR